MKTGIPVQGNEMASSPMGAVGPRKLMGCLVVSAIEVIGKTISEVDKFLVNVRAA